MRPTAGLLLAGRAAVGDDPVPVAGDVDGPNLTFLHPWKPQAGRPPRETRLVSPSTMP